MPVKLPCGCPRRAAAEKGVKHNAAFRTARLDTGFGKFWRERGEMPALVGNGIDKPHVPPVPHGRHEGFVVVAAASRPVKPLYFPLSGYFVRIFLSRAAPGAVPRRRCGG